MPCVSRVDSYSHVRDCGSYQQDRRELALGDVRSPPIWVGMDEHRNKYLGQQCPAAVLGRTHSNWALTLPMPTQSGVRKWEVFSVGATRTHCSPLFWGKRGRSPWAPLVAERRRDPLN